MITWTKKQAREYLVRYHMINTDDELTKDNVLDVFDRIKTIQVDPLDVVGKNVDLVLQSRIKQYKKGDINHQLYKDRTIIQGWDKQMSIYQTKEYPFFSHVRAVRSISEIKGIETYLKVNIGGLIEEVKNRIKFEGPKFSSELQLGDTVKGYWGTNHKESKLALGYLFHSGEINIRDRKNNHKQYDLTENLIGDIAHEKSNLTEEEFTKQYLLRRIQSLGLASNKSGVHMSGPYISTKTTRTKYIKELIEDELIHEVQVEGYKEILYIPDCGLHLKNNIKDQISFIAPLDNIIWDRDLIQNIFDFYYRWEVYTPAKKREYGYYVLPILYKSEFIGRIEFKNHKKNQPLEVLHIWYEPHIKLTKKLETKINQALKRFTKYNRV